MNESCVSCIYQEEYAYIQKNDAGEEYETPMTCCSNRDSDSYEETQGQVNCPSPLTGFLGER